MRRLAILLTLALPAVAYGNATITVVNVDRALQSGTGGTITAVAATAACAAPCYDFAPTGYTVVAADGGSQLVLSGATNPGNNGSFRINGTASTFVRFTGNATGGSETFTGTFQIGDGFNDPTPATPVGGNNGTTIGQQRLNAFAFAADLWGDTLDSPIEIRVQASFDALTCTATGAVLGSAGTIFVIPLTDPELTAVAYGQALANKLVGADTDPSNDISARFNSGLGQPNCLTGTFFYYGLDGNEAANQIDLTVTLLHEFGHGLGFQSFVERRDATSSCGGVPCVQGSLLAGFHDQYERWLYDNTSQKQWPVMTNAERATSMKNGRKLVWIGPQAQADAHAFLNEGTPSLRLTAPASLAGPYVVGTALFGAALTTTPISANFTYVNDGVVGAPIPPSVVPGTVNDGCEPLAAGSLAGRIAFLDRGYCAFTIKVKNAQDAGAIAVVVGENAAGSPPADMSGVDATIVIPSVRIGLTDANNVRTQLNAAVTVTGSLATDPTVRAGADGSDRPMLYATDPVITGSTINHYDTSASPNVLMEPNINADLPTTGLDLTPALMSDIGWYPDEDVDLVPDEFDNCRLVDNFDQLDSDADDVGDACDDDDDGDGVADASDNCGTAANTDQADTDSDGLGDACDADDDNDGVFDAAPDNCSLVMNAGQEDWDADGEGDACDDSDSDGTMDATDNCRDDANADQTDTDSDGVGNACDADDDNDGIADATPDNCSLVMNAGQEDLDGDGEGDACEGDTDGDGVPNTTDNCDLNVNVGQEDLDGDDEGDDCDLDDDGDGAADTADNCPVDANPGQEAHDADGTGDACDTDDDGDSFDDGADNCPVDANDPQTDTDSDGAGDACDGDDDADGDADAADNCPINDNGAQEDLDGDGEGDVCDADDDDDTEPDASDNCPRDANTTQLDTDLDDEGNACDVDDDGDGVVDGADNCPLAGNTGQANSDTDAEGDACDTDDDEDGDADGADNCSVDANADQADLDGDGDGDVCDDDDDDDGMVDVGDTCPILANPDQADHDGDRDGDACDTDDDDDTVLDAADNCVFIANPGQENDDDDAQGNACDPEFLGGGDDGCGCTVAERQKMPSSGLAFLAIGLVGLVVIRRRRRR